MSQLRISRGALLLGFLMLTLAACDGESNAPPAGSSLSDAMVQDLGQEMADELTELADASVFDPSTGLFLSAAGSGTVRVNTPPPACVSVSPASPANSDGDIVPDSVRLDFGDCAFSRGNGQILDSLNGTIDFLDPQPMLTSLGVRHIFTDFTRKRTNTAFPLRSFSAVHNGIREWGGNADTLGHTIADFVSVWTHAGGRVRTHEKDWVAKFTATTAGTIGLGLPLPAGNWVLNGTSAWTAGARSWSVATTTSEPLQYDPACTVTPRLTDGTLDLVVTRGGEVVNVQIVFLNCGQYQVTRTPGGSV